MERQLAGGPASTIVGKSHFPPVGVLTSPAKVRRPVRSKPPLGRKAFGLVKQVNKWMSISKLAMMDLLVEDWVPHGGLPTCLTIPKEFRPRSIQCDNNPVNNRISRES